MKKKNLFLILTTIVFVIFLSCPIVSDKTKKVSDDETKADEGYAIGDTYQGGKIAYILQSGDPGYDAAVQHGLIAAIADQSNGIIWAKVAFQSTLVPGGTGTVLGTGSANTSNIITQNGTGITYAAGLAREYSDGVYMDWYLPSKDELNKLYLNRVAIGGFAGVYYWSSSEDDSTNAWTQGFDDDAHFSGSKGSHLRVRAF